MVARLSQRSTKTPAKGPTNITAALVARTTPLTACGPQDFPSASTVATHRTSVVLNTASPTEETAWPNQSRV